MGHQASQEQKKPNWDHLYGIAAADEGYFTTAQAAEAGYSGPLLAKYLSNGRISHIRHGIYRLVHFPPGEHEDLVVIWLWSEQKGIFSHETALSLHQLSDVLPKKIHLTVPASWKQRRLRVPAGVMMHYEDLTAQSKKWIGPVPVTSPVQTIKDCVDASISPEIVDKAIQDGLRRGLFTQNAISKIRTSNDQSI